MVWSNNQKIFYFIDTSDQAVKAFDFNCQTGCISSERLIIEVPKRMGAPDGMTIDCEGMLWIALWGGSCITRWNPENGKLLEKVELPTLNVTSCTFGGENMQTLYITTAQEGLTEQQLIESPLSGGVFQFKSDVKGYHSNFQKPKS